MDVCLRRLPVPGRGSAAASQATRIDPAPPPPCWKPRPSQQPSQHSRYRRPLRCGSAERTGAKLKARPSPVLHTNCASHSSLSLIHPFRFGLGTHLPAACCFWPAPLRASQRLNLLLLPPQTRASPHTPVHTNGENMKKQKGRVAVRLFHNSPSVQLLPRLAGRLDGRMP